MSHDSEHFHTFQELSGSDPTDSGSMPDDGETFKPESEHSPGNGDGSASGREIVVGDTAWLPLYEAKMIHHYDHRWAGYLPDGSVTDTTEAQHDDPGYEPMPRYWVERVEVDRRLAGKGWDRDWLMGWRDICRSTDERTTIACALPRVGVGNSLPLMFVAPSLTVSFMSGLIANLSCLVLDFVARHKAGGTHLNFFIYEQLPVLPPADYTSEALDFITARVVELTYTSHTLAGFAADMGYDGPPFPFDPDRRAALRAELDAWYAHAYGLTRDELRYVLDPADVMDEDYPSETFRGLKKKELDVHGEYRTQRLVLTAYDELATDLRAVGLGQTLVGAA